MTYSLALLLSGKVSTTFDLLHATTSHDDRDIATSHDEDIARRRLCSRSDEEELVPETKVSSP
jgi:hypothetical protein